MLLRRIELMGFKSFADKTSIEFGPGISAIVGPNGSGKSNVIDAVRWVLGEGSARALRGQRMEDVIFAGAPRRRPVPLAEVALILDNGDGTLPVPFAEVSVTRRVDRSGTGDYLINRRPCRLRDVQELFAGTGLGRSAFALLGQGEVDDALRARPAERRAMVEEAAGVSRFHLRLHEGRRRLQGAAAHEQRLQDIVQERQRALATLARQAQRAERHERLAVELRVLELGLFARDWAAVEGNRLRVQAEADRAAAEAEAQREALQEIAGVQRAAGLALSSARAAADAAAAAYQEARRVLDGGRQEVELARALRAAAGEQARRAEARAVELGARQAAVAEEVAAADAAVTAAAERLGIAQGAAESAAARLAAAAKARQAAAQNVAAVHAALAATRQQAGDARRAETAEQEAGQRRTAAEAAAGPMAEALARTREAQRVAIAAAAQATEAAHGVRRHRDALREWVGGVRGRLQTLEEVIASGAGYAQGVRTVLAGQARKLAAFEGVIGPLGSLLEVPPEVAAAIAAALGGAVQDLVTVSPEAAQRAIEALKAAQGGRATFLPLGGLSAQPPPADLQRFARAPGALGWAAELVGFDPAVRQAVIHALGRVLVARDLGLARGFGRESGYRLRVVTLDGEVVHPGGAMSGGVAKGERRGGGLLGLPAERARLSARYQAAMEDLRLLEAALGRATAAATAADGALAETRRALAGAEAGWAAAAARVQAARDEEARCQAEGQSARERREATVSVPALEDAARAAQIALGEAEQEETHARELATAARIAVASIEQEQRGAADLAAAGRRERDAVEARLRQGAEDLQRAASDDAAHTAAEVEGTARVGQAEERLAEATDRLQLAQASVATAGEAATGAATRREWLERERERGATALRQAEIELARLQAQQATLIGRLDAGYGLGPQALQGVVPSSQPVADRQRVAVLRQELTGIGGVRPESVEEHRREADEVVRFTAAVQDVRASALGLIRYGQVIEGRLQSQYEATLVQVRQHFDGAYRRLCGGGHADLVPVRSPEGTGLEDTGKEGQGASGELSTALPADAASGAGPVPARDRSSGDREARAGEARADGLGASETGTPRAKADGRLDADCVAIGSEGVAQGEPEDHSLDQRATALPAQTGANIPLSRAVRPAEAPGLEIIAQPPGKQPAHLGLLSGGERTLVAVALLLAFLQVKPTAFCILDEVEAALDEANVERCASYLTEMADTTQFIVVTHQRGTMAAASRLIGVTMGESGVSTLLSVRLSGGQDAEGNKERSAVDVAGEAG